MKFPLKSLLLFFCSLSVFSAMSYGQANIKLAYTPFKDYAYIQTDYADNKTNYYIEYDVPIEKAEIRPYNKNVKCFVKGKRVDFILPAAGHYVAFINGFRILIFAHEPEKAPFGNNVINVVTDLKIDNSGMNNQTKEIENAIIGIAGSNKTLYFPKGKYLTSQLKIINKDNIEIYIEKGAVIMADTTTLNYRTECVYGEPQASTIAGKDLWSFSRGFIIFDRCNQISIRGNGMIDGQGRAARRNAIILNGVEDEGRYRNFIISRSENVLLEDIISADPGEWNTHILSSNNVTCRRVKLMNELRYSPIKGNLNKIERNDINTDGFDLDASTNVLIKDCFGYCADDNIAIKTSGYSGLLGNLDGVIVEGCVFLTKKSSLKIGTETGGTYMRNILFKNNDVLESDRAIAVYCYDGAEISAIYDGNRIETSITDLRQALVSIEVKPRLPLSKVGKADIQILNTTALMQFPKRSHIVYEGNDSSNLKVSFVNFEVEGKLINNLENEIFEYNGNPHVSFR